MERVQLPNGLPVEVAHEEGFTPAHFSCESGLMWLYVERPGPVGRMWVQVFRHGRAAPASAEYLGTTLQGAMQWHLYDVTRAIIRAAGDHQFRAEYGQLMGWSDATIRQLWGDTEATSKLPVTAPLVVVEGTNAAE